MNLTKTDPVAAAPAEGQEAAGHPRPVEEALALLLGQAGTPPAVETLPLAKARGRVCGRAVAANHPQPPFDRSPLDGYAFRSADLPAGKEGLPAPLKIAMTLHAGDAPQRPLRPGEAARLMTGSPLPEGCDCVVRQEDTRREDDRVWIETNPGPRANVIRRGEDLPEGALLLRPGAVLESAHLGILAGQGLAEVDVYEKPRVGVLSTGSELTPPGQPLAPGKIYDSNGPLLAARLETLGALPVGCPSADDEEDRLCEALENLLGRSDLVITTGGASVGERDLLPRLGELLGAKLLFSRLRHKPGGGVWGWEKGGRVILCLSGNPFAAAAAFELLAAPLVRKMGGAQDYRPRRVAGALAGPFLKSSPGRRFVRACYNEGVLALPAGNHSSGSLAALAGCNCLIDIPAGSGPLKAGDTAEAILFLCGES